MLELLEHLLNTRVLVTQLGAVGVFLVLFAETGLLIGFFLPGDSLLFSIGVLAATGALPGVWPKVLTVGAAAAGALLGSHVGYVIGDRGGAAVLRRVRNERVHHAVDRAGALLERYGHGKALLLGRFIPVVRTVVSPVCGIAGVPLRRFTFWQVLGGLIWTVGMSAAGYLLGRQFPEIDKYLLPMIAVVVAATVVPVLWQMVRPRRARGSAAPQQHAPAPVRGEAGQPD